MISLATWKGPGWCRWCNKPVPYVERRGKTVPLVLCKLHTLMNRLRARKRSKSQEWEKGKRGRPPVI